MVDEYTLTQSLLDYTLNNIDPYIDEREVVDCVAINDYDLLIKFRNGTQRVYDTFDNSFTRLTAPHERSREETLRAEFKHRLRDTMDRQGIDEAELARRIGSTQPMISRYMRGKSIPNYITITLMAEALNCTVDDFKFPRL